MAEKLSLYGFSTGVGVGAGEAVTSGEAASEGEPCSGGATSEESVPEEVVLSVSWLSLVPEGVTELSLVAYIAAAELCHLLVFSFVCRSMIYRWMPKTAATRIQLAEIQANNIERKCFLLFMNQPLFDNLKYHSYIRLKIRAMQQF